VCTIIGLRVMTGDDGALKYNQWLSDDLDHETVTGSKTHFLENRIHLCLESLTTKNGAAEDLNGLQDKLIGNQLNDRCVVTYEDFQGIVTYQNWKRFRSKDQQAVFDADSEKEQLLKMCTKDDLRFVMDQLDIEFERKIGDDYSYIHELLEE
jgi:hypothetical protein